MTSGKSLEGASFSGVKKGSLEPSTVFGTSPEGSKFSFKHKGRKRMWIKTSFHLGACQENPGNLL